MWELLYFLKVFRTAFGSCISQSNYSRVNLVVFCSPWWAVGNVFLQHWAVEWSVCLQWLHLWSETQCTLLVMGKTSPSVVCVEARAWKNSSHCFRCVWVFRLHHWADLWALPGWLLWQCIDWHTRRLSTLPLPGPYQLCPNCTHRTGGLYQLPYRTDRWDNLKYFYGTTQYIRASCQNQNDENNFTRQLDTEKTVTCSFDGSVILQCHPRLRHTWYCVFLCNLIITDSGVTCGWPLALF